MKKEATEKAQKDVTKKALNDIESKVQLKNRPNPLDGNIVDLSDPTRKPKNDSFVEQLMQWMQGKTGDSQLSSAGPSPTLQVSKQLQSMKYAIIFLYSSSIPIF